MAASPGKLSPFQLLMLLLAMGATFWMMFAYIGPFQWIAEFQLAHMGSYSEKLTFVLTFLVLMGGLMLVTYPIRKALGATAATAAAATGGSQGGGGALAGGLIIALVGLGFLVAGGWKIYRAQHAGAQATVSLDDLEAGKAPTALWVTTRGIPLNDVAVTFGGSSKSKFVPIISGHQDPQQAGARLFLKLNDENQSAPGSAESPAEFDGMLFHNDLPGPVRISWQKDGLLKGGDHYVLDWHHTPGKEASHGRIMAYIGGGIAGFALVLALIQRIRRPNAPPPAAA
jgi:hypothetical protein